MITNFVDKYSSFIVYIYAAALVIFATGLLVVNKVREDKQQSRCEINHYEIANAISMKRSECMPSTSKPQNKTLGITLRNLKL